MLAQPQQNGRAPLDAVTLPRLLVGQLAFFYLINHRQLKASV